MVWLSSYLCYVGMRLRRLLFVFYNTTATTEIYTYGHTLSLHDALPTYADRHADRRYRRRRRREEPERSQAHERPGGRRRLGAATMIGVDRATGQRLDGNDHLAQSIGDILSTPIGTRVMRRDYGSMLTAPIGSASGRGRVVHSV